MVCKHWQGAVDSKFTRPVMDIELFHILDGQLYNIERIDGMTDRPGYNLLTDHHIVTHLESGEHWNIRGQRESGLPYAIHGYKRGPGPKICRGSQSSWVYEHEKKRPYADNNPIRDQPRLRRPYSEVLQEFAHFEKGGRSLFASALKGAFTTEAAVYYKAPEEGEVEVWTAKDVEELVFRSVEHIVGRHMMFGIGDVKLHYAHPEHIPTIVLYLRNYGDFSSFPKYFPGEAVGDVRLNDRRLAMLVRSPSERYGLDNRVTENSWDKIIPPEIGKNFNWSKQNSYYW
ncbi:hypothetical protein HDU93_007407 [Gonapodya sp. JEL0774]|nr:hypothetical protein HDU93_007407 [Gonapodya sp. JEL0774]